jgi:phage shock protein C
MTEPTKRLYRARSGRMIAGVCAGLGDFFGIDPTLVRLGVAIMTFLYPGLILAYLLMMLIVPEEPASSAPLPPDAPAAPVEPEAPAASAEPDNP